MNIRLLLISAILIVLIPAGCSKDTPSEPEQYEDNPVAGVVDYSGCKTDKQAGKNPDVSSDQDCVEFIYDETEETLELIHLNAGFNCCPGEITANITFNGDTISILEKESEAACRCLCLFDISYMIEGVSSASYTIRISEPYINEDDKPVEFTVDLELEPAGKKCFLRKHYPWNTGYYSENLQGVLVDYDGCKGTTSGISDLEIPGCLDCVQCFYGDQNTLFLKHLNATFNCCPEEIIAEVVVSGDTIMITEDETEGLCDCHCLFDLEYEINDIYPGEYTVIVNEPYLCDGDQPLVFQLEIPCFPNYCYCLPRTCYPWETYYTEEEDLQRIDRMEKDIQRLLIPEKCGGDGDCVALPYGDKPCGGPLSYVAASSSSDDFSSLVPRLCVFRSFQDVVNRRYGYKSDCSYITRPEVECSEGYCRLVE